MKVAYYIRRESLRNEPDVLALIDSFSRAGLAPYAVSSAGDVLPGTSYLVSIGGDGTFLSASVIACRLGIPLLGVNFGHLGFLAEAPRPDIASKLASGECSIVHRHMLELSSPVLGEEPGIALNEVAVHRRGPVTMGIDVSIDGHPLPAYWADGIIIATASGSTAYNLSAGGPICAPEADVMLVTPIAPHNLGVRPLVVPGNSEIGIRLHTGSGQADLSMDNRMTMLPEDACAVVRRSSATLECVSLGGGFFINALRTRLFWGEDIRNSK